MTRQIDIEEIIEKIDQLLALEAATDRDHQERGDDGSAREFNEAAMKLSVLFHATWPQLKAALLAAKKGARKC